MLENKIIPLIRQAQRKQDVLHFWLLMRRAWPHVYFALGQEGRKELTLQLLSNANVFPNRFQRYMCDLHKGDTESTPY